MLQLMLHAHPDIAIPPETRFLLEAYDRREQFGDLRERRNRRRFAKFITRRRGKLGIHIIRDGRDCVSSLTRMPWWDGGAIAAIWTWCNAVNCGRRARRRLPPDAYTEVRYEDLIAAPEAELRRLCAFLGEAFHDRMLEPHQIADVAVPARKVWHTRTRAAVDDSALHRWRDDLQPWERDLFHLVARRQLRATGYPLQRPGRLPPIPVLVRYARYHGYREAYLRYRGVRDRVRQWRYRRPVAAEGAVSAGNGVTHSHDLPSGALR